MPDGSLLNRMYNELCEFRAEVRQRDKRTEELLEEHHTTLYGDGNGNPGLRLKTDRLEISYHGIAKELEERKQNRGLHFWTIWGAVLTSIGAAVASWFAPRP